MKVEIRVGDTSSRRRKNYVYKKSDNTEKEVFNMYNFLANSMDCIIDNVDNFLLYALNTGIMAFIVRNNPDILDKGVVDEEYDKILKFDPQIYKVFEIKEDGTAVCIQDKEGNVGKNYYNSLMRKVMDDYLLCLSFYEGEVL